MSHTPGPWMLNGWDIVQRDCDDSFPPIAIVGNARRTLTLEEIDANAWLIAAAPELLRACKELLAIVEGEYERDPSDEPVDAWRSAIQHAVSAIHQAEGRADDQ